MLITSAFAGEVQEEMCGDKSLSYCINRFEWQCEAKNYNACWVVGVLHHEQEQYSEAKKYYEMVCDKANRKDSYETELIDGRMGPKVPVIIGMQVSCSNLGKFYYNSLGARQSYEKAFQYFNKACDLGSGESCAFAGGAYYVGKGVKKDLKSAIKLLTKSCELESGFGCAGLGAMYHYGEGVKQNLPKAKELYGKACDFGNQKGCDNYKELKEKGY